MQFFRNIFWVLTALAAPLPASADAPPWAPVIGKWRAADYGSCGVDDTRFGRITSVSDDAMLTDKIHCSIEGGAATAHGLVMEAICEVGANYYAVLTFDWTLTSDTEAVMTQDGYEKRLIRCKGEVE